MPLAFVLGCVHAYVARVFYEGIAITLCCVTLLWFLVQLDANNIEGICKQKLRLDSEAVLGSDNQQALAVAVTQLQRSYEEAAAQRGDPPVLDPVADLKLNQLEVVDTVRERQRLMQACNNFLTRLCCAQIDLTIA